MKILKSFLLVAIIWSSLARADNSIDLSRNIDIAVTPADFTCGDMGGAEYASYLTFRWLGFHDATGGELHEPATGMHSLQPGNSHSCQEERADFLRLATEHGGILPVSLHFIRFQTQLQTCQGDRYGSCIGAQIHEVIAEQIELLLPESRGYRRTFGARGINRVPSIRHVYLREGKAIL